MDSISTNTQESGQKADYTAENIRVLAGREAVRARPGMYIGDTTLRGVHHIVYEAVDNSVDEALAGFCTKVIVTIHKNGFLSVEDNGRGIPVEIHQREGISALTLVLTKLHAGGKFDKKTYKVSGGLHGVGISVTNFLSESFEVWVKRNGKTFYQKFEQGIPIMGVEERGTATDTGTRVKFLPDKAIFPDIIFNFDILTTRLRELSYLNHGIEIHLVDERVDKTVIHKYDGGLKQFVEHLNKAKQPLHPIICFSKKKEDFELEIAMQYTTSYQENVHTFANNISTHEGGTHLIGFKSALTRVINSYIKTMATPKGKNGKKKTTEEDFSGDDVREGLTAIISVKIANPQFEGQTKTKLGNSEVAGIVNSLVVEGLSAYLQEHPADARLILAKCDEARRAREAARKAKELARKGVFEGGSLPGKLADCSNKDPAQSELFIVEGDSAGGCFSGDTQIALADGRNISFTELIEEHKQGKENYCHTIMDDGNIGIQKITNPRKTKTNAAVIKIILDNNEQITCTPDHLFMVKDGTYKHASDLKEIDALMAFHRNMCELVIFEGEMLLQSEIHSVKQIIYLTETMDVYDIEVPGTHNFALESGVFVHNSAKQGRSRESQAILPLRGKIINVEKARIHKVFENTEIKAMIIAIGCGVKEDFNIGGARYHKIILATDADVDGSHIRTLLLTFIYRFMHGF